MQKLSPQCASPWFVDRGLWISSIAAIAAPSMVSMTSITSHPQEVLRCKTTADFLAAVPRLLGFIPQNSLLIVFFSGNRSGSTLRVDLPVDSSSKTTAPFLNELCLLLRRLRAQNGAGSPAIVISCPQTFAEAGGIPWRRFARSLERRLAREGDRVRELCCIAPDAWASYLDPSAPLLGRSLKQVSLSHVADNAKLPSFEDLGAFVPASDRDRARVAEAIERRGVSNTSEDNMVLPEASRAAHVSASLVGLSEPNTDVIADTILSAGTEEGWSAIFEQITATAEGYLVPTSADPREEHQREAAHRLRLASDRLTRIVSLAPDSLQPPVMAASAIAWWLRGLQSVAHRQISQAFALDPGNEPVRVIHRFIESGDHFPIPTRLMSK